MAGYYPFAIKVNDLGDDTFFVAFFFEQVFELLTCDFLRDFVCRIQIHTPGLSEKWFIGRMVKHASPINATGAN